MPLLNLFHDLEPDVLQRLSGRDALCGIIPKQLGEVCKKLDFLFRNFVHVALVRGDRFPKRPWPPRYKDVRTDNNASTLVWVIFQVFSSSLPSL